MSEAAEGAGLSILILGTADWNQPIATNQHYMTRELAALDDARITFVESMALRSPELSRRDLARIARRLAAVVKPVRGEEVRRPVPAGTRIASPVVAPAAWTAVAAISRAQLRRAVADWRDAPGIKVLWTYTPVTYGLEAEADVIVYHCVDLLGEVPGISAALIDAHERRLAEAGARAAGSSPVVVSHLEAAGFGDVQWWPNVADVSVFEGPETDATTPVDTADRSGAAVFAGNLTTTKVDFDLLAALVDHGIDLHLAGPVSEGGGNARPEIDALVARGATYHGMLGADALARLYRSCAVGLIPYVQNSYTRGVSPLKTFEYLAAGLAVTSTPIPAVVPSEPDVVVAETAEAFVSSVLDQVGSPSTTDLARRRALARANSWTARGETAREFLTSKVGAIVP
ncbi:glycosyltransferase [Homoserinibacter sp. GY 40078]|uniref:glycosyltransferase n=1 Tax=Homoserinibacter sp. GY 40078 TaxID=2603275 RepID=UPI0011CBE861|nr:glycosyltransferase [Homoserinibacter sp. GY 40078]TXK19501.1 glycosyltransferase family 1 protein [Homoserinibacter sp. GY 40078]